MRLSTIAAGPTILAEARLQRATGTSEVLGRLKGSELIGRRYTPLFAVLR